MHKSIPAVLVLSVVLGACSVADNARTGLRPADENTALVVFNNAPFGENAENRVIYADPSQREEYVRYQGGGGMTELVYITTRNLHADNIALDNWLSLDDIIALWNYAKSGAATAEDAYRIDTDLAAFWAKPFTVSSDTRKCAVFRAEWDTPARDPEQRPSKMLLGYVCGQPGIDLTRDMVEARLEGIGIRGITLPRDERAGDVAAPPPSPAQATLAAAVNAGPHGSANFPFELARFFRVSEGCNVAPCP